MEEVYERLFGVWGRQLSTELSFVSPLVALPPEDESGIYLGRDRFGRRVFIDFYRLKNAHGLVVGPSGAGKSTFARDLGVKWRRQGGRAAYIDPSGEQADWVRWMGGIGYDLRRGVNADSPYEHMGEEWYHRLARITGAALNWPPQTTSYFESLLLRHMCVEDALKEAEARGFDPVARPVINDLQILRYLMGEAEPLVAWEAGLSCFALYEMSEDIARFLGTVISDAIWRYGVKKGIVHRPELLLILDEAHRYVELRPFVETQSFITGMARVVRKYAVAVVILTQRVHDVESAAREQIGWKIALPGSSSTYLNSVAEVWGANETQLGWLASANVGRALVYKEGSTRPSRVYLELSEEAFWRG